MGLVFSTLECTHSSCQWVRNGIQIYSEPRETLPPESAGAFHLHIHQYHLSSSVAVSAVCINCLKWEMFYCMNYSPPPIRSIFTFNIQLYHSPIIHAQSEPVGLLKEQYCTI